MNKPIGWVKLHRSIYFRDLAGTPAKGIFLMIIALSEHEPTKCKWKGKERVLAPGQVILTNKEIEEQEARTPKQVREALFYLKTANKLTIETSNQGSLFTVINYELYQKQSTGKGKPNGKPNGKPRANEGQTDLVIHKDQALEPQEIEGINAHARIHTEEIKKKEEYIPSTFSPPIGGETAPTKKTKSKYVFDDCDMAIAIQWAEYAREASTTVKVDLEKWANEFRLMRVKDKVPIEVFQQMLEFARNDYELWRNNAVSPMGLRKVSSRNDKMKHENLRNAMERAKPKLTAVPKEPEIKTSHHLLSGKFRSNGR